MTVTLQMYDDPHPRCEKHFQPCAAGLTVKDLLDRLVRAARHSRGADIDAANCRTDRDFKEADDAELMQELVYESVALALKRRM